MDNDASSQNSRTVRKLTLTLYILFALLIFDQLLVKLEIVDESLISLLPLWIQILLLVPIIIFPLIRFLDIEDFRKRH